MAFTFKKEERLGGLKIFEELTSKGSSFFAHPFRIVWMKVDDAQKFPVRIAFAVPKRNFKRAVKRNRIKRQLREAYRLHKEELYSALKQKSVKIAVMLVYTPKEQPDYAGLEGKIILSLQRLLKAVDAAGKPD
ncbi:MAG TPA: ribonuclease P protein component [Bacteroidia bacterium]|nr:ribonuclease P protein component [Bacteroidia bacterium]